MRVIPLDDKLLETRTHALVPAIAITERQEQVLFMDWCRVMGVNMVHIPNEGKRHPAEGVNLRRQGLRKGFPDYLLLESLGPYHGLVIELKVRDKKKAKVSPEQQWWLAYLGKQDYCTNVCYGADEAIAVTERYLRMPKNRFER